MIEVSDCSYEEEDTYIGGGTDNCAWRIGDFYT
jgi:hypothetical protein